MPEKEVKAPRREIELDFLRGLAILAVLEFHIGGLSLEALFKKMGFPVMGWMGVDVFFVLSGFLVGGLLIKEWRVSGGIDSKRFLIRRGFKIWPQYYLFLILNLVTGHRDWHELWPAFLNIQNYIVRGPAHLWSLGVEEHAYLLLVAFLAIASVVRMRMRTVFWVLAGTSAFIVCLRATLMWMNQNCFTQTHTRVEAIFYGVMLAIVFHCRPVLFRKVQDQRWIWFTGLALALAFDYWNPGGSLMGSLRYDAANLIGICALMLTYRHQPELKRSWLYRLVAGIGLYSYGIYLWHVAMISVAESLAKHVPAQASGVFLFVMKRVLGIVMGILLTRLIEFPMLRLRDKWFPRKVKSAVEDSAKERQALEAAS